MFLTPISTQTHAKPLKKANIPKLPDSILCTFTNAGRESHQLQFYFSSVKFKVLKSISRIEVDTLYYYNPGTQDYLFFDGTLTLRKNTQGDNTTNCALGKRLSEMNTKNF